MWCSTSGARGVLGVSRDFPNDTAEKWAAAVKKHNVPWLHVRSEDGIAEQKFRVQDYPYKVLISPEGTVLNAYLGETEEFYQYLDSTLEQ